jgi:hypothetical protein
MPAFPTIDVASMSDFSGRPQASYTNSAYVTEASRQALLLFKIGSCLKELPEDETEAELVTTGLNAMADSIYLAQEYQKVMASPFQSESIASYSYAKMANSVANGKPTGVMWFDLAITQLGVCNLADNFPMYGGIEVFERDFPVAGLVHLPNNKIMLSPQDIEYSRSYGYDPAPGYINAVS